MAPSYSLNIIARRPVLTLTPPNSNNTPLKMQDKDKDKSYATRAPLLAPSCNQQHEKLFRILT